VPNIALFRLLKELRAENQQKVNYLNYLKIQMAEEEFTLFKERIEAISKRTIELA
jgi:16S rRNA G527 N7-methylase RsmG